MNNRKTAKQLAKLYSTEHADHPENVLWNYPAAEQVVKALKILVRVMFPGLAPIDNGELEPYFEKQLDEVADLLAPEIECAIPFRWQSAASGPDARPVDDVPAEAVRILSMFFATLPSIREMLIDDVSIVGYN